MHRRPLPVVSIGGSPSSYCCRLVRWFPESNVRSCRQINVLRREVWGSECMYVQTTALWEMKLSIWYRESNASEKPAASSPSLRPQSSITKLKCVLQFSHSLIFLLVTFATYFSLISPPVFQMVKPPRRVLFYISCHWKYNTHLWCKYLL
jgi:hypothetical protein